MGEMVTPSVDARKAETFTQSFARGLAVIRAFGPGKSALRLGEVAELAGVTRATARRVLLTLETLGYASQEQRRFRLTPRILDLGFSYLSSLDIWEVAEPSLADLSRRIDEANCSVSVLDGNDIVIVSTVKARNPGLMTLHIHVGTRMPAYAAAMGRVLLGALDPVDLDAYLDRVRIEPLTPFTVRDRDALRAVIARDRAQGWSISDRELSLGLVSLAVPLVTRAGRTLASMNLSAPPSAVDAGLMVRDYLPELQATQRRVNEALRGSV